MGAVCACQRSYAICIPSHVSGVEPKAFDSRIAISTDTPVRPFNSIAVGSTLPIPVPPTGAVYGDLVKRNFSRKRGTLMLPQHRAVSSEPFGGKAPWITLMPRVSRNSATGTKSRADDTRTAMS